MAARKSPRRSRSRASMERSLSLARWNRVQEPVAAQSESEGYGSRGGEGRTRDSSCMWVPPWCVSGNRTVMDAIHQNNGLSFVRRYIGFSCVVLSTAMRIPDENTLPFVPSTIATWTRAWRSLAITEQTVIHYRPTICADPTPACENSSLHHGRVVEREAKGGVRPTLSTEGKLIKRYYLK